MVINLQQCEFCKEASLSIKFTHPEWRTICKKNTLSGGHGKARWTVTKESFNNVIISLLNKSFLD